MTFMLEYILLFVNVPIIPNYLFPSRQNYFYKVDEKQALLTIFLNWILWVKHRSLQLRGKHVTDRALTARFPLLLVNYFRFVSSCPIK